MGNVDVQFPLDQGLYVVKTHGGVWVRGAKGVESRPIPIFIQAGQRFLARFGCDGGVSESECHQKLARALALWMIRSRLGCAYLL